MDRIMSGTESRSAWEGLMKAARGNPLGVYVVIVLVVEAGLVGAVSLTDDGWERIALIIGMVVVLVLVVIFIGMSMVKTGTPKDMQTIWSKNDLPIPKALALDWYGTWNCRWTYQRTDGRLFPYVDDNIVVEDVDESSGFVSARGITAYDKGVEYKVSGRISKRGLGVFFYSSAGTKYPGLDGTFILRRSPLGKIKGWWMGNARTTGEVQGDVTFEKAAPNDGFEPKVYPLSVPKTPSE
ncbi:MAG: hypothetical protein IH830_14515 [Planctomycetes bacterium]|nr:hypothetical protein [Planctomycetota bacterium]